MDFYKAYDLNDRWAIAFTRDFDRPEPVVYFLDKKYKHTNVCGIECQITCGAYYVSTILGHKDGYDLCLDLGVPAWTVPAKTVALAKKYCQEELQGNGIQNSRKAIKSSDEDWLADVRRHYGKILLPPRGYNPKRPKNDERVFSPADEERIHELSKSIHNKIKNTVKIADPDGNGNWTITPMHEQLYVLKDDGTTELLEKLSVEDLEYINSFCSLEMMKSSCEITSARRNEVDSIAADELALCTENDGDLYRQMTLPVIDNLKKKMAKGVYDEQLALKAWLNVVTAEARKYVREFGSPGDTIDRMFNLATREEAAKEVARYYEDHLHE